MFLKDLQETGECKCWGLFLVGNSSLIMNRWTLGRKRKYNLSPKLKFYILIQELLCLGQVGWLCCRNHWVILHSLGQKKSKVVLIGEIVSFKATNSCFSKTNYPIPVAPYLSEQAEGRFKCLHRPDINCIQFYFNPHSSNFKLSLPPIIPADCFTPLEEMRQLEKVIKIKTHTKKNPKTTHKKKQASELWLEELDSPTIAGSIHIKLNKEQTSTRRWAKWLGGRCLSLILCWLSPAPC